MDKDDGRVRRGVSFDDEAMTSYAAPVVAPLFVRSSFGWEREIEQGIIIIIIIIISIIIIILIMIIIIIIN